MSTASNTLKSGRNRWTFLGGIVGAIVLALFAFSLPALLKRVSTPSKAEPTVAVSSPARTVAEGEAGVVGDLTVTEEAMQLADITVAPMARRLIHEKLAVTGVVEPGGDRLARITPRVAGKVSRVFAVVGDEVRAGQTLALLESAELAQAQAAYKQATARIKAAEVNLSRQRELARLGAFAGPAVEESRTRAVDAEQQVQDSRRRIQTARADLTETESAQDALNAEVQQAETALGVVSTRLARTRNLFKEELVSRQELEQTEADQKKAEADVTVAKSKAAQGVARLASTRTQVKAAEDEYALAQKRNTIAAQSKSRQEKVYQGGFLTSKEIVEAETALRQARLDQQVTAESVRLSGGTPGSGNTVAVVSPLAGRVQERAVTLGETVDTQHPLFTVVNLGVVWANLQVAPRDLSRVRVGMPVELTFEGNPGRTFSGKVASTGTVADETTRAVPVRVALSNPAGTLRPGAFVRGSVVTDVRREQIAVPEDAVQEHTGKKTVYVAVGDKPGAFEVRHILVGEPTADGLREVKSGLKGTERIAVHGTFYLKSEALKSMLSDGCCAVETKKE